MFLRTGRPLREEAERLLLELAEPPESARALSDAVAALHAVEPANTPAPACIAAAARSRLTRPAARATRTGAAIDS